MNNRLIKSDDLDLWTLFPYSCQNGCLHLIDKSNFLYNLLKKKKNCVFYLCQEKNCQATVEPSDDVLYLVTCVWDEQDNDLMKLHTEKLSRRKWHLAKTSVFLVGLLWQTSQGNSGRQTRAKRCSICQKLGLYGGLLQL